RPRERSRDVLSRLTRPPSLSRFPRKCAKDARSLAEIVAGFFSKSSRGRGFDENPFTAARPGPPAHLRRLAQEPDRDLLRRRDLGGRGVGLRPAGSDTVAGAERLGI